MRILVVDDSMLMRNVIRSELKHEGYEIIEAHSGEEAIEQFKQQQPDLVTMDITMDGMDGIETAKAIFKLKPEAKIIMVTALDDDELMSPAIKLGIQDFIVKPFTPERLITSVYKALT